VTPEEWKRLRAHFDALCELPADAREAALQALDDTPELIERLRHMLAADTGKRLAEHVVEQAPAIASLVAAALDGVKEQDWIGQRLGPWRILSLAGTGGMGHVFRARRDDGRFQAEAAIKIVSSRFDAARFVQERAVLARLQHPGIARLLDGGECPDGRPFLVMEFVDGQPIDRYCAAQELPPMARLRLVLSAARAAAYAHARAVLHRDLKPDNILVDANGRVSLLDFGVAKLLDADTVDPGLTSARYFTPHYAAPEQLAGEPATTATDVFSLALVLYELLAERHPFADESSAGTGGLSRRVMTGEAIPLGRALRQRGGKVALPGNALRDLDAVLGKALQRDPQQRFASMDAFADELERILSDQPVFTRAASATERAWRWTRRHRLASSGIALGLLGIGLGTALALWQAREAGLQRDAALLEATRAERVAAFLSDVFRAPNPAQSRGSDVSARDLLERGRERIGQELSDDPVLRLRLQRVIADTYRSLGDFDPAESLLREALASAGLESKGELLSDLGWLHAFQGRFEESASRLQEAVELLRAEPREHALINALQRLATPLINLDRLDEAEAAASEALELLAQQPHPDLAQRVSLQGLLAGVAFNRGHLDEAEQRYRESLETNRELHGPRHTGVAVTLNNLATVAFRQGELERASDLYREAIAMQREFFGLDNAQVASPMGSLGLALRRLGHGEAALTTMREAGAIFSTWSGKAHRDALAARLDAAELAVLLERDARDELDYLTEHGEGIAAGSVADCRRGLLAELMAPEPDLSTAKHWIDCLDEQQAPIAVRAQARLMLAWLAPDAESIAQASAQIVQVRPRDALLDRSLQALREKSAPR